MLKTKKESLPLLPEESMKVLIVAKQNTVGMKSAKKLISELGKYTEEIFLDPSTARKIKKIKKLGTPIKRFDGELIITLGGDGTFLWTAQQTDIPILPVRLEGNGFLCTADFKDLLKNLDRLMKRDFRIEKRFRLRCTKVRKGVIERYVSKILRREFPLALNEIVFARKRPSKVLCTETKVDDATFSFVGDGVMFSTPSGSTAYNVSAGGSIIDPQLSLISIVPLYPFYSKVKPMIVPADKKIEIRITGGDCALIIDGHGGEYIRSNTDFIIEKGEPVKIINLFDYNFYTRLKRIYDKQ